MNIDGIRRGASGPSGSNDAVGEQAAAGKISPARRADGRERPAVDRAEPTDTLELSAEARQLARARRAVESAPDTRAEKVAAIKRQIQAGTYVVSAELLARKLLSED